MGGFWVLEKPEKPNNPFHFEVMGFRVVLMQTAMFFTRI
jgi:hypothetical protein